MLNGTATVAAAERGIPPQAEGTEVDPLADIDIDGLGVAAEAQIPPPPAAATAHALRPPRRGQKDMPAASGMGSRSQDSERAAKGSEDLSRIARADKGDTLDAPGSGKGDLLLQLDQGLDMNALPPADPALATAPGMPYQLEVFINGQPTGLIGEFFRLPSGEWALKAREMRDLGLRPPAARPDDALVRLAEIGARVEYDEARQRLDIFVDEKKRLAKIFDLKAGAREEPLKIAQPGTGMVLNYHLLGAARTDNAFASATFEGLSASLDGWIYSPYGNLAAGGILRMDDFDQARFIRLSTTWRYTDRARAITYQAGDFITRGPRWARPLRLGGLQAGRNFRARPDLVTVPLPSLSATAAVPTTVDVYLNNVKIHSQQVPAGPFTISNIPTLTNTGEARLVMQDAAGREIVARQRFFISPSLLRGGLLDFSLAAGVARRRYGMASFDYDNEPVGTASLRYGLNNRVTLHGHAEFARRLFLAGGGMHASLFDRIVAGAAGAVSHSRFGTGFLVHGSVETKLGSFSLNATAQHVFGEYADLTTLTAASPQAQTLNGAALTGAWMPEALDTVTASYHIQPLGGSLSVGYVHSRPRQGRSEHHLNVGYSQRLMRDISLYATAFVNLRRTKETSFFAGLSMPLGGSRGHVSSGFAYDLSGRYRATASYDRPLAQKDGAVGWRARVTYGDLKSAEASLAWRTSRATLRASAMRIENNTTARASVEGAVVVAGGSVFASNRIHDSFAIVDAGAPGVTVRYENRVVGKTGRDGRLLVTSLRTLERNKISIDPDDLPVDARIPRTKEYVVPPQRSGVVVDFGISRAGDAALVTLVDAAGKPLPAGYEVFVPGRQEPFLIGYDGQVYLEGLKPDAENEVRVVLENGECHARFRFAPQPGEMVFIGPVACR